MPDGRSPASTNAGSLGDRLVASGRLTPAALERARRLQVQSGSRLEVVLTQLGLLGERDLAEALADLLDLQLAEAGDFPDIPVAETRISAQFLKATGVVPLEDRPDALVVAMTNPRDAAAVDALRFALDKPVLPKVACPSDVEAALRRLYGDATGITGKEGGGEDGVRGEGESDIDRLKDMASEAPVIRLVHGIIAGAVTARASDIHIEPGDDQLRVRYRVDGYLHDVDGPPASLGAAIASRIKIMARLNIAERRLAQDGRVRLAVRGQELDLRVSTSPTLHGESVVLRLLDRQAVRLDYPGLGFDAEVTQTLDDILGRPHGIMLVTGPTGSGKTTTLYAALSGLNKPDKKILTIEDPVEYEIAGINQLQVKPQIGRTFAGALRSFLRQDPDIIMIGEIRDAETAQVAVQAALTGHLILSTLHTNDAASAITRLLDMGAEDYLLTSTLNGVVAQRLVRTLCPRCKEPFEAPADLIAKLQIRAPLGTQMRLHRAVGCEECGRTGYLGRTSILEVMVVSEAIRHLILRRADARSIHAAATAAGMRSMHAHGMTKVLTGETTVEEIFRATRDI